MKKLYGSVLLVLLPAILYAVFFFANDPHDYFGLKATPADFDSLTGHMIDLRRGDYNALLLGDSRTARVPEAYLNETTGLRFKNMSFAGCTIQEYAKLFWWAVDNHKELERVVIVTSFYGTNEILQHDRVTATNQIIQNPVTYAFNVDSLKDLVTKLKDPGYGYPTVDINYTPEEKAANFEAYGNNLSKILSGYSFAAEDVAELTRVCDYCNAHDIDIYFVLPAWWKEYFTKLDESGLLEQEDSFKRELSLHAEVLDLEYPGCPLSENYDDFRDYTHARGYTLEVLCSVIAHQTISELRIWKNGNLTTNVP